MSKIISIVIPGHGIWVHFGGPIFIDNDHLFNKGVAGHSAEESLRWGRRTAQFRQCVLVREESRPTSPKYRRVRLPSHQLLDQTILRLLLLAVYVESNNSVIHVVMIPESLAEYCK